MHKLVAEGRNPSSSSSNGHTLLLLLERLEEAGVPYVLEAHPGLGYMVTGKPELKPKPQPTEVELTRERLNQQVARDRLAFAALSPVQQDHYTAAVAQLRSHTHDCD
jgi:hypothetical protein